MPNPLLETLILDSLPPTFARRAILDFVEALRREIESYRAGLQAMADGNNGFTQWAARLLERGAQS